jgi:hypothetical protein
MKDPAWAAEDPENAAEQCCGKKTNTTVETSTMRNFSRETDGDQEGPGLLIADVRRRANRARRRPAMRRKFAYLSPLEMGSIQLRIEKPGLEKTQGARNNRS